jgi:4-hydroxyphenylpyruvate dioxygenase-like putative hemolysin
MGSRKQHLQFDHIAIPVGPGNLKKYKDLFQLLGFEEEWYRQRIGNEETAMETVVMSRGSAKFALMEGIDGKNSRGERIISQVNEYYRRFGFFPQHIALRCEDIKDLLQEWSAKGIRFLTEDENHKPRILVDQDGDTAVLQSFTYPINKSWFFEVKQIIKGPYELGEFEEFRDHNVEGLWESLDRAIKQGWLFKVNIFGDIEQ